MKRLFLEANKGENVKEVDLPDAVAPERKKVIDGVVKRLAQMFPEMFKPSERCRPPHLHRDTLRNKLFHHPMTEQMETEEELLALILKVNKRLENRPQSQWADRLQRPLEKAKANGCFLGLCDYAWLDQMS